MAYNFGVLYFKVLLIKAIFHLDHAQCSPKNINYQNKQLLNIILQPNTQQQLVSQAANGFPKRLVNDSGHDLSVRQLIEDSVLPEKLQTRQIEQKVEEGKGIFSPSTNLTKINNFGREFTNIQNITKSKRNSITQTAGRNYLRNKKLQQKVNFLQNKAKMLKHLKRKENNSSTKNFDAKDGNCSHQEFDYGGGTSKAMLQNISFAQNLTLTITSGENNERFLHTSTLFELKSKTLLESGEKQHFEEEILPEPESFESPEVFPTEFGSDKTGVKLKDNKILHTERTVKNSLKSMNANFTIPDSQKKVLKSATTSNDALLYLDDTNNQDKFSTTSINEFNQNNQIGKILDFVNTAVKKDIKVKQTFKQPAFTFLFNETSENSAARNILSQSAQGSKNESSKSKVNDSYFAFSASIKISNGPLRKLPDTQNTTSHSIVKRNVDALKIKSNANLPSNIFPETQVTEFVFVNENSSLAKERHQNSEQMLIAGYQDSFSTTTIEPLKNNKQNIKANDFESRTPNNEYVLLTTVDNSLEKVNTSSIQPNKWSDPHDPSLQSRENETLNTSAVEDNIEAVTQVVWLTQSITYLKPSNTLQTISPDAGNITILKPEGQSDHLNELIAIIGSSLQHSVQKVEHIQQEYQRNKSTSAISMRRKKIQEEVTATVNCHTAAFMSLSITSLSSSATSLAMVTPGDKGETKADANANNSSAVIEKSIESNKQNIEKWSTFKNNQLNNDSLTKSGNFDIKENVNAGNDAAADATDVNLNSYGNAEDKENDDNSKGISFVSNKKNVRLEIKVKKDKDTANRKIYNNVDNDGAVGNRNNDNRSNLQEQKEHKTNNEFKISHTEGGINEMSAIETKLLGISEHRSDVMAAASYDDILETYNNKNPKKDNNIKENQITNKNLSNNNLKIEIKTLNADEEIDNSNTPVPVLQKIGKVKLSYDKITNKFNNMLKAQSLTAIPPHHLDLNDTNTRPHTDKNITVSAQTKEEIAATNWWNSLPYAEIRTFLNSIIDSVTSTDDDVISNESINSMLEKKKQK